MPQTNPTGLMIETVEPGSAAHRAGIAPGDRLTAVAGRPVLDTLDYRFRIADADPTVTLSREAGDVTLTLRKDAGEDAGLTFAADLADRIHTCNNKCVFCFIHQMPKRMRRSLYLMDDDFRLSFIHGNYITLTNMSEEEFARVIEQRLSPLYVSVHATEPGLRGALLGKREPAPILPRLRSLAENRIDVHAQVVLCPDLNDGAELERTVAELAAEHPALSGRRAGVQSVAVVPVGLTRYRERLPNLRPVDRDYAREMVAAFRPLHRRMLARMGTRFVWLSDEWYFKAGLPVPGARHYEDFPQLEDGIGTVRLFLEGARRLARRLPPEAPRAVSATLVTAELAADVVRGLADRLNAVAGVDVNVCVVRNHFFGGGINIAGLLTAQDIGSALADYPETRPVVYIPSICLRDDPRFLDDVSVDELRAATGRDLRITGIRPSDLAQDMGLIGRSRGGGGQAEE